MVKTIFLRGWGVLRFIFRWIFKAFRPPPAPDPGAILMTGLTLGAIDLLTD